MIRLKILYEFNLFNNRLFIVERMYYIFQFYPKHVLLFKLHNDNYTHYTLIVMIYDVDNY